jgi:hypothetical protein
MLARGYGLIVGLIALALGSLAWFASMRFTQAAGIALRQGAVNAGTLPTLMNACVLTVLNFGSGLYLARARDTAS